MTSLPSYKGLTRLTLVTGAMVTAANSQPVQDADVAQLAKRADLETTDNVLIDGNAPQGPIVLVAGALGVAILCLIFAIIKTNINSGKALTQERHKAKTDLRLRGGQISPGTSRTMLSASAQSPTDTPRLSRADLVDISSPSTLVAGKRSSTGRPFSHGARGYSGSSVSRNSGMKSNYASFSGSSLADMPMLGATGRVATTMSQASTSSGERSMQQTTPAGPRTVAGPRPPLRQVPSGHRHSTSTVYRGTNLYAARNSTAAKPVPNPAAVETVYSPKSGAPRITTGAELKRYASDSRDQSRRNSVANLMDDDPFTPLSPYHSAPSSAEHSSHNLSPVQSHPLSGAAGRPQGHSGPSTASSNSSLPSGTTTRQPQAASYAPPYPTSPDAPSTLRPASGTARDGKSKDRNAGFFQYSTGADEEERGQTFEQLRPGQLAQPVGQGDGRRGNRGRPAGDAPAYV